MPAPSGSARNPTQALREPAVGLETAATSPTRAPGGTAAPSNPSGQAGASPALAWSQLTASSRWGSLSEGVFLTTRGDRSLSASAGMRIWPPGGDKRPGPSMRQSPALSQVVGGRAHSAGPYTPPLAPGSWEEVGEAVRQSPAGRFQKRTGLPAGLKQTSGRPGGGRVPSETEPRPSLRTACGPAVLTTALLSASGPPEN